MYWLTGILGAVSVIAPFMLGYGSDTTALWTSLTIGVILMLASAFEWAAQDRQNWEYWVAGSAGLAAVLAPFVLRFESMTILAWTLVLIGFAAMGIAGTRLFPGRSEY